MHVGSAGMGCIGTTPAAAMHKPRSHGAEVIRNGNAALLNLLRTKVRETETLAAQVFITP